jgi:drug/metabolite transporter (DMT)-like permease
VSAGPYAGILLALFTTTAFNVGLIVEKRALDRMPPLDIRRVPRMILSLLREPAWLAGFALMLTGLACQVTVLTFEPVSVVQPVLASGIALVLVLSRLVLRERLGGGELWCVAIMGVALLLIALSEGGGGTAGTGHDASTGPMIAVVVLSAVAGLLIATLGAKRALRSQTLRSRALCSGIGTGLLYGVGSLASKGLSGVLTGHHDIAGIAVGVLSSPYLYLLGGCSAVAMLLYQAALQVSRASILIPTSSVTSSVYFVIAGTWLFHEHLPADPVRLGLRVAGIAMAGLVLVTLSRPAPGRPLPGKLVDGEPGLADEYGRPGQPSADLLPGSVGVVDHEPYPGGAQGRGQRTGAVYDPVEPPGPGIVGR